VTRNRGRTRNRWQARNRGRTRNRSVQAILARRGPFRREKVGKFMANGPCRARISSTERLRARPRLRAQFRLRVCHRLRVTRLRVPKKSTLCDVTAPKRLYQSARHLVATTTRRVPARCVSFVALAAKRIFSTCPNFHRLRARHRLRVASGSASSSVFCVPNENGSIDFFQIWRACWDRRRPSARQI